MAENSQTGPALDLDAYLRRVGYSGARDPTAAVLEALHRAHAAAIPFENLDILLGRPIRLDLESLQEKLVRSRRGGYCFEQNLLFASVLEALGFRVTRLAARVRYRTSLILPRTHMTLLVDVEGAGRLADVGFGAEGLLAPVPFGGAEARQGAWTYRIAEEGRYRVLQSLREGSWMDLYAFTLEPQEWVDYDLANYYTSTHPQSRFTQTLTAQRVSPEARLILRNRELIVDRGGALETRLLADDAEVLAVLARDFDLPFPPGTRFSARDPQS
jgi:N-hydroxyarylamine O-acetyltransferase